MKLPSSFFLASLGVFAGSMAVRATDFTWLGTTDNDWAKAANWSGTGAPPTSGAHRIQVGVGGTGGSNTYATRVILAAEQGTFTSTGGGSNRALLIGNGGTGYMEIRGGSFISNSTASDIMANNGNGYLYITGGTYQKTSTSGSGTFGLVFSSGTSLLQIDSGTFAVTTLDFQNSASTTNPGGTTGTIQLNGGTLSVGAFVAGNPVNGTRAVNLNGGIVASRANSTWGDIAGVDWVLQSNTTFNIGHTVTFGEPLSGAGGFIKTGDGNFILSGGNTYSGVTTVSTGALTVGNNTALGATGAGNTTTVADGARIILANGVTVTGEALTINGTGGDGAYGALRAAANATATWDGTITTTGTDTRVGAATGGHLILKGNIDATARALTIRTEGGATTTGPDFDNTIVTLEGTYTGTGMNFFQGVLKLGASERIADNTVITFGTSNSANIRQRFDLNGFNETIAGIGVSGSGTSDSHEVTNSSTTRSTLTLNSTTSREFSGIVTGNLAIQKQGSNTVTLSGINTYSGDTSVTTGNLTVSATGALNGGTSTIVASGATFSLVGTYLFNIGANGVNNSISGPGTLNLNGIFNLNLATATIADGNQWTLVNGAGTASWTGLQVTSNAGAFTNAGVLWTLLDGDHSWTFNQNTGVLSLAVVPEPSHAVLLLAGLSGMALRRRRVNPPETTPAP